MHDLMFQADEVGSDFLWIAGEPGLVKLNLNSEESKHWSSRSGLFADRIMSLAKDDQDRIWLISDTDQIGIYDLKSLQ